SISALADLRDTQNRSSEASPGVWTTSCFRLIFRHYTHPPGGIMLSRKSFALSLGALCLSLAMAVCAWAQTATSNISGAITDATGAVVPGAKVTAKNEATGVVYSSITTSTGNYSFASLTPGRYTITVQQTGFRSYTSTNNDLTVGAPLVVDVV